MLPQMWWPPETCLAIARRDIGASKMTGHLGRHSLPKGSSAQTILSVSGSGIAPHCQDADVHTQICGGYPGGGRLYRDHADPGAKGAVVGQARCMPAAGIEHMHPAAPGSPPAGSRTGAIASDTPAQYHGSISSMQSEEECRCPCRCRSPDGMDGARRAGSPEYPRDPGASTGEGDDQEPRGDQGGNRRRVGVPQPDGEPQALQASDQARQGYHSRSTERRPARRDGAQHTPAGGPAALPAERRRQGSDVIGW